MKIIVASEMLRLLSLTTAVAITLVLLPLRGRGLAQEAQGCFWVSSSGRTLSLDQICRENTPSLLQAPKSSPQFLVKQGLFQAVIKRRAGGTPVIDVVLNGQQTFEMIVDTGASGTVITQKMARVLGIVPIAKAKFDTASAVGVEMPIGRLTSVNVNGAVMKNLMVPIAGPDLDIGLLGHDFFGDYDITIKRDVVEFRVRQ